MTELKIDESFVLWIDRKRSQPGELTGRVEQTRNSLRVVFGSTVELVRFLEHGVRELLPSAATTTNSTTATVAPEDRDEGPREAS